MNQLSWLIYLADVANSSEGWLGFFGWVFGLIAVFAILLAVINQVATGHPKDSYGRPRDPDELAKELHEKKLWSKALGRTIGWSLPAAILAIIITIVVPSRETLYAIAASELGEQALQTPLVGKMGQALEAWLDRQITPAKPAEPSV